MTKVIAHIEHFQGTRRDFLLEVVKASHYLIVPEGVRVIGNPDMQANADDFGECEFTAEFLLAPDVIYMNWHDSTKAGLLGKQGRVKASALLPPDLSDATDADKVYYLFS